MRRLRLFEVIALLATVLALAGFAYLWLGPGQESCTSSISRSGAAHFSCTTVPLAASMSPLLLAVVLLLSAAFALLPALFSRRAWVGYTWFGIVFGFYLISFGVGMQLLPAAAAAAAGSVARSLST